MKLTICATNYRHAINGSRVMHLLAYLAHCLGHEVDVRNVDKNPEWGDYSHFIADPDIILLHELDIESFPDEKVIRWVLYYPGGFGFGPLLFPRNEFVVAFCPEYVESCKKAAPHQAEIPVFELATCELPGLDDPPPLRDNPAAWWFGKGKDEKLSPPEVALIITRQWPEKRRDLVTLLRRTRRFYSSDQNTTLCYEAQLCGCHVLLLNEETGTFESWRDTNIHRCTPLSHEGQLKQVDEFLKKCAKHLGLEG
jgi:hypothetical protein